MRLAHSQIREADTLRDLLRPPVQPNLRLPAAHRDNLDVLPADAPHARAQRLHHGLLAGESRRKLRIAHPAGALLLLRIDAIQKPLAKALPRLPDPPYLNHVDSGGQHNSKKLLS